MLYCNECAKKKGWQTGTLEQAVGLCKICRRRGPCHDVPISQDEWIIVESQAGAGSLYEVWPAHYCDDQVIGRVKELEKEGIGYYIYKVQTIDELTFCPASLQSKGAEDGQDSE